MSVQTVCDADDETSVNRMYILPSSSQQSSPPWKHPFLLLFLLLCFLNAAAPSFCWGRSRPGTIRSASRWSCGAVPESPRCRHCASQLPGEAERDERKGWAFSFCLHISSAWISSSSVMQSYLSWSEGLQSCDGDLVIGADLVVVWRVAEGQWQQALLLQVGFYRQQEDMKKKCHMTSKSLQIKDLSALLDWPPTPTNILYFKLYYCTVNSGKALDDDGSSSKMPGLQRSVLSAGTLTVVVISNNNPGHTVGLY